MAHNGDPHVQSFLDVHGWAHSHSEILAADASMRQYFRLKQGSKSAILMDARRSSQKETQRFCQIAELLKNHGLKTPEILAQNLSVGLLLLEDFGDDLFARIIERDPSQTRPLYQASLEMLIHLRGMPLPDWLRQPSSEDFAEMISPFWEYYIDNAELNRGIRQSIVKTLQKILASLDNGPKVVSLRDCHTENLMRISGKSGFGAVGLLDFQDAFICHPSYDLVSLLQDARRDVSPDLEQEMLNYYLHLSQDDSAPFLKAYRIVGVQRNLRILGIFSALAAQKGKRRYLDLQPRVCGYLRRNLSHPVFGDLRSDLRPLLNGPSALTLQRGSHG
jgi:N-acetylmuramate 1-kinase